jgi:hypothetical protein
VPTINIPIVAVGTLRFAHPTFYERPFCHLTERDCAGAS